jgi:hypothetical protein
MRGDILKIDMGEFLSLKERAIRGREKLAQQKPVTLEQARKQVERIKSRSTCTSKKKQ